MISSDMVGVLHDYLKSSRRSPDGLLHCSGDLVGSLRHSMLTAAGAPRRQTDLADDIVLMTGTMWHQLANDALVARRLPFMQEVKLDRWLPEGWSGTADWIFYIPEMQAFRLRDFKTIKGDGIAFVEKGGAKDEHLWQLSSYWHALYEMGLPLVEEFDVIYWPKDRGSGSGTVQASVQECSPLPRELVHGVMESRWAATKEYLDALYPGVLLPGTSPDFVNDRLAPEQDRVQKVAWNPKQGVFDLRLTPHWSAAFCPFDPPLCDCRNAGITKIGHYTTSGVYVPRDGFKDVEPMAAPSPYDYKRRSA